jgi:hypothetical protein
MLLDTPPTTPTQVISRASRYFDRAIAIADAAVPRERSGEYGTVLVNPASSGLSAARTALQAANLLAISELEKARGAADTARQAVALFEQFAVENPERGHISTSIDSYLRAIELLHDAREFLL